MVHGYARDLALAEARVGALGLLDALRRAGTATPSLAQVLRHLPLASWEGEGGIAHYFEAGQGTSRCGMGDRVPAATNRSARVCRTCVRCLAADLMRCSRGAA